MASVSVSRRVGNPAPPNLARASHSQLSRGRFLIDSLSLSLSPSLSLSLSGRGPVSSAREAIDPARNVAHAKLHSKGIGKVAAVVVDQVVRAPRPALGEALKHSTNVLRAHLGLTKLHGRVVLMLTVLSGHIPLNACGRHGGGALALSTVPPPPQPHSTAAARARRRCGSHLHLRAPRSRRNSTPAQTPRRPHGTRRQT